MMIKLSRKVIAFVLFITCLSGCGIEKQDSDIVSIRLKEDITTLDPAFIVDVAGGGVSAKLYNGLVKYDEELNIVSDIAGSWDISKDGLRHVFYLRSGVKFSDGTELTAEDIKQSFSRVLRDSPRKWIFEKVSEIKIMDSMTLEIILKEPFSPFLSFLALPNAYITPDGKIGTGPYVMKEWEYDEYILLEPNPYYFGEKSKVSGIEYRIVPEELTAFTEFELGNLDIMEVSPNQWADEKRFTVNGMQKYSQVGLNTYYIGMNFKNPIFKNRRFRQALNCAVDKDAIIKSVMYGQAVSAWGPVPPALSKTKNRYPYKYLPNKAKKLIGENMPSVHLKLYVRAQAQAIQIAEVVQFYLSNAGIKVDLMPVEWSAFKKAVTDGDADMFLMSWWADYPDPENFLYPCFHSKNKGAGGNRCFFENGTIDKLIESAQREMDPVKREKLYEKLQRYISRQAPWIFLWHSKELVVAQACIDDFKLYPVYSIDKGCKVRKSIKHT